MRFNLLWIFLIFYYHFQSLLAFNSNNKKTKIYLVSLSEQPCTIILYNITISPQIIYN